MNTENKIVIVEEDENNVGVSFVVIVPWELYKKLIEIDERTSNKTSTKAETPSKDS